MSKLAALPESPTLLTEASVPASARSNKYHYPEFAGWDGERYLKKLLRQILPMALYRTWEIFADHQAIGNECYLGVARLAEIAGRTTRTMEKNLASLCAKQLLAERAERKEFCGPGNSLKSKVVVVKDFSGLYALAHEYHEWLNADDYLAPTRGVAELIAQSLALTIKLRRFNNYRRVLYNRHPGPQPSPREEDSWFTTYQAEQYFSTTGEEPIKGGELSKGDGISAKKPAISSSKELAKSSEKRIRESSTQKRRERDSFDSAHSSSKKKLSDGEDERHATAEAPAAGVLTQQTRGDRSDRPGQSESGDQALSGHRLACSFISEIAAPFGDLNQKGTTTRICSILREAAQDEPAEVLLCLVRAYGVARDTRTIRAEHCHAETGRVNRMPLFCALFQRFVETRTRGRWQDYSWQLAKEELAADELLARWWKKHQFLVNTLPDVSSDEREGERNQPDEFLPGEEQVLLAKAPSPRRFRHPRLSQTEAQREERAAFARKILQRFFNMAIPIQEPVILWEHVLCGCPLYHKRAGKEVCALCSPDPTWPDEVLTLLRSLVEEEGAEGSEHTGAKDATQSTQGGLEVEPEEKERSFGENAIGWLKREDASACGTFLLDEMARHGYVVEVYVHPVGERYHVIVRGADGELVCETAEQATYLIEQARNKML